jgi:hypothetical protein
MNNVLFRRGDQTFIDNNVPLNDGQIIFNETDEAIYVDNTINGSVVRKRYGGGNLSRSDIDSALSTTSENPIQNKVITTALNNKAPKSHASAETSYGVGTTANYGHNKIIDGLTKTSLTNGESLSAHQGNVLAELIAPVQSNLTARRNYSAGDFFIYNSTFYQATAPIANGASIVIDGNCTASSNISTLINNASSAITSIPVLKRATLTWHPVPNYVNGLSETDLNISNVISGTFSKIVSVSGASDANPWAYFILGGYVSPALGMDTLRVFFGTNIAQPTSDVGQWTMDVFYI